MSMLNTNPIQYEHTLMADIEAWGQSDFDKFGKLWVAMDARIQTTMDAWNDAHIYSRHTVEHWTMGVDDGVVKVYVTVCSYCGRERDEDYYTFIASEIFADDQVAVFKAQISAAEARKAEEERLKTLADAEERRQAAIKREEA